MSKILRISVFILIAATILFLIHLFVYKNISKISYLNQKNLKVIRIIFIISGLSVFAGPIFTRFLNIHFIRNYAYIWLGFITIIFSFLLLSSIFRIFIKKKPDLIITLFLIAAVFIAFFSLLNQSGNPVIKIIKINSKKITGKFKNFKIVQISDLHIEPDTSLDKLMFIQKKINDFKPDIIVLTGDIIEYPEISENIILLFKNMHATSGKYAVTGNHEYYIGLDSFYDFANKASIKIMENETIKIGDKISLTGIDDIFSANSRNFNKKNFKFLEVLNKEDFNILLAHRPYGFRKFSEYGIDLQLSGHTHSGQIPPMDLIVQLYYKYPEGLYRFNDSYIYTNPGTGYWGPPMRFLSKSELLFVELE